MGLFSIPLKKSIFSLPFLALAAGVIPGPEFLNVLNPLEWNESMGILELATKLTIAVGLLGAALRLPRGYFITEWKSLFILLLVGMPLVMILGAFNSVFILYTA